MKRLGLVILIGMCIARSGSAEPPPPAVELKLPDQYEQMQDLRQFRGDVVVLLYGDRNSTEANRSLGAELHVHYHPTARGQSPEVAAQAPVKPLPSAQRAPEVHIIPVACVGSVPRLVRNVLRNQIQRAAPHTPVWLDFGNAMQQQFGLQTGVPNLVVVDAAGRLRFRVEGKLNAEAHKRLIEVIDYLRQEAAQQPSAAAAAKG